MNKTARYSLIAAICGAKLAYCVASKSETREEIALSVSQDDKAQSLARQVETGNDDFAPVKSSLSFDSAKVRPEREESVLLSRTERAEIRRDLLAYRMREDARQAKIHAPFALALLS